MPLSVRLICVRQKVHEERRVNGLPANPADAVCYGLQEFDIGDPDDKEELLDKMVKQGSMAPLSRPPCSMLGAKVDQKTMDRIFAGEGGL